MISHKHKCIYIHIQRTGGTTIERWLQGEDQWNIQPNYKHITATFAKKIYSEYWNDYFKFAFIRNPSERVISELNSHVSGMYSNYLILSDNPKEKLLKLNKLGYHHVYLNGGSMINGLEDEEWNLPEFENNSIYKNITRGIDKVYKYEEWDSACADIQHRLGLKNHFPPMVPGGTSQFFHYKKRYTVNDLKKPDIDIINDLHMKDFEEYGYERL